MTLIQPFVSTWEKCISSRPFIVDLYSRPYRQVVEKEAALAGITSRDRVLNIGCGAAPFTAVHLAILTGAQVWAMDLDPRAVQKARLYLQKIGLGDKVKVFRGNGAEIIPGKFDAAIVALQALPKEGILRNLLSAACPGGRLVFRLPSPSFSKHYDSLPPDIKPEAAVRQNMQTFDRSLLFVKSSAQDIWKVGAQS